MNRIPRFFTGVSYSIIALSTFGALASIAEVFGLRPLGEATYESSTLALFDFILNVWCAISVAMMLQKQRNGLSLFNASFGANIVFILKDSHESPWEVVIFVALTLAIFWFYNRGSVRTFLAAGGIQSR